ncbi:30S ribosomal protein S12 methylthiotransferase accessory factor YcaO [Amphritea balenae]|uniref:30s ribosomal protein S12 methylthiotransferase accessory protein YcaO n=1 Tax=Amphritea balenae TaxID=452629 RepID=A0A3P1SI11_9GAMM|nr:30S ribosomal protein S12 methylthiotransferase accessory factor YcaO [Amphritea balenae]RRC96666.1 30s ribosomal protein S12 methylthiotransferase accessory protein YcaO [Amphritea balenae]GGK74781.1 hypothetical protein GCM10007941_26030 [Amphritea balenae]
MTMIPGKDAPLEESISRMSTRLQSLGFEIEEVQWLNPVPNVWSVHIRDKNCSMLSTNGKGSSRDAALASALGEYFEQLSCNYFFADYYLGSVQADAEFVHYPNEKWFPITGAELPDGLLDEPTLMHYNMSGELKAPMLVDSNSGNSERGICAIPFIRQRTGNEVWIPVNIIGNLYVSNGMSAGNNRYEARVQALSEIFERHIKNTIISSGIGLPAIPQSVLDRYPSVAESIEALRGHGFVVLVKDASLGGKFPLVNVTLINPADGGCFASFGAHPKFEVALERTLAELLQGRALNNLVEFPLPSFDIAEVADQHNLETHFADSSGSVAWDMFSEKTDYEFTEWNIEGDTKAEFEHLCHLIHKVDMDIYIADYDHLGIDACRIVVPGMSEIYPVDELVWNNNNAGVSLREQVLKLSELTTTEAAVLSDKLEESGFDDQHSVAELIGIVPDKGTAWSSLRVGELKCLLNLKQGELTEALDWCDWVQHYGQLNADRTTLYRCLQQCLMFTLDEDRDVEDYQHLLTDIYGEQRVTEVQEVIAGKGVFTGLAGSSMALEAFGSHLNMLAAYARLQQAKKAL